MTRRRPDDDDDDILKDGEVLRVRMALMDSLQRSVLMSNQGGSFHNGFGGAAFRRPGFVFGGLSQEELRRNTEAKAEYEERLSKAWQSPGRNSAQDDLSRDGVSKSQAGEDAFRDYVTRLSNAWRVTR